MKLLKILFLLTLGVSTAMAQDNLTVMSHSINAQEIKIPRLNFGAEIQWYPAGWIYGARADLYLGKHTNWNFRIAYNDIDRKDFSTLNDTEVGGGLGASLGYRYYFGKRKGIFVGGRADVWGLRIDWTDASNPVTMQSGTTNITVLQPTIEVGYQFFIKKHWVIAPAFTNGYELNVVTKGDEVMGSFVTLIGVNVGYKLF
jgi:hypothetical protein